MRKKLTRKEISDTKKYSIADASTYNVMYGFGEQYVVPYALKLGATSSQIGILSSVPAFIGALFQVVGAKLTDHYQDRKKVVTLFVFLQALMVLPLFIVPLLTKSMLLLTAIFSLYLMFNNAAAPAWNSWIGSVIPDSERAQYFSRRNKISITVLLISVLLAGVILNYFTDIDIWIGFGILFVIAFFGRIASWYYLTKQSEPPYIVQGNEEFTFKDFLKKMPETNFGNFVMFRSLMAFAVMIASPFFAVYMLQDLGFTYIQFTAIILFPMLIKILTVTYWGRYSKQFGTRNIMIISSFLIALIPAAWFFICYLYFGNSHIFFMLMAAEVINGFSWAGFELTTFNYVLETVIPDRRAKAIAYFNIVFGVAVLIGGLLGSYLAASLPAIYKGMSTILMIFAISAIARFIVPLMFLSKLKEVKVKKEIDDKKLFMDLVINKPVYAALNRASSIIILAEEGVRKASKGARKGIEIVNKPIKPVISKVIQEVDEGLERVEPLRKAIEPKSFRKAKKRDYDYLVKYDYDKYLKGVKKKPKNKYKK